MKTIGNTTDTADKNGEFQVDETLPATEITPEWLNTIQREIISVLTKAGIKTDVKLNDQLTTAILYLISSGNADSFKIKPALGEINLNDLNGFEHCGTYPQYANMNVTYERNYPTLEAGNLTIVPSPYGVTQEYTAYGSNRKFIRARDGNSGWTKWREVLINEGNIKINGSLNVDSGGDYTGIKLWRGVNNGIVIQTQPANGFNRGSVSFGFFEQNIENGGNENKNSWSFIREGNGATVASREWSNANLIPHLGMLNGLPQNNQRGMWGTAKEGTYAKGINLSHESNNGKISDTVRIGMDWTGYAFMEYLNTNGTHIGGTICLIGHNVAVDGNGFLKKSSPVVTIYSNGSFETNNESEGVVVERTNPGQYEIKNILGYNSDKAWGVNGGIVIPKNTNNLELVYIDDRIQPDGSIVIETFHRQHIHLPERFQNWRLKEIIDGERVFYSDGEQCDLPPDTQIDVRVQMPEDSIWNTKMAELLKEKIKASEEEINNNE